MLLDFAASEGACVGRKRGEREIRGSHFGIKAIARYLSLLHWRALRRARRCSSGVEIWRERACQPGEAGGRTRMWETGE